MRIHPRYFACSKAYAEANIRAVKLASTYGDIVAALVPHEVLPVSADPERVQAIREAIEEVCREAECGPLTPGERMMLVGDVLCSQAKYLIRIERHGDAEKRGGEE